MLRPSDILGAYAAQDSPLFEGRVSVLSMRSTGGNDSLTRWRVPSTPNRRAYEKIGLGSWVTVLRFWPMIDRQPSDVGPEGYPVACRFDVVGA